MAKRFAFSGIPEPYATTGYGVGKWDRIMTYGHKVQYNADGTPEEFDFTIETFGQVVDNFARTFSMRRLGLDYKHLAANPGLEKGPEQNLAYYSGLAVIFEGKVVKIWDHFPDRVPPDPQQLLQEMQQKFPRLSIADVDGLWGYKSEVTPLGMEKLPNCEQLSPLFSKNDRDEFGNPIGYNLLNASAVGVAFQNGTLINLGKPLPVSLGATSFWVRPLALALSRNRPLTLSKGALTRNNTMNETLPSELMGKLMKHGLAAEHESQEIEKAFAQYMAETEDGPTERKAVAEMYAKCMAKMDGEPDDDKAMKKMDDTDLDGSQAEMSDDESDEDKDKDENSKQSRMGKLAKAQEKNISALSKEHLELKAKFEKLERKNAEIEKTSKAVAFARRAVEEGRWRAEAEADLVEFAKAGQGELAIKPYPKGTFSYMQKWTEGGGPKGRSEMASLSTEGGAASRVGMGKVLARGAVLSAMAKRYAEEKKISLQEAQLEIARKHPELYTEKV